MMRVLAWFRLKWFGRRDKSVTAPPPAPSGHAEPKLAPPKAASEVRTVHTAAPQPPKATPAVPRPEPVRDAEWARQQGVKDRAAGKGCWTYTAFLTRYRLPKTPASLRLWAAYMPLGEQHLAVRGRRPAQMEERRVGRSQSIPRRGGAAPTRAEALSAQREKELRNLGARAETQGSGVVSFRVNGRVVDQFRAPGGPGAAAKYVAMFNVAVSQRHVNPADTLPDTWR